MKRSFKTPRCEADVGDMQRESFAPSRLPVPPPPPTDWFRAPYGQTPVAMRSPTAQFDPGRCQQCGAGPALPVVFRRATGMILMFRMHRSEATLCRSCGLAIGRAQQSKTLITGWWGLVSFFCNIWFVLRNAVTLLRLGRLSQPTGGVRPSLVPGRSAFLRSGAIFAVLLLGAWIFIANGSDDSADWSKGSCVRYSLDSSGEETADPAPCSESNDGRIVAAVASDDLCPVEADGFVELEGSATVYCVDEDH